MTQLLPVALRGLLPENVRLAIVKLCAFLNAISQKVINPEDLPQLQNDVAQCLVSFELVFPPSFFNIMTHLLVYLVERFSFSALYFYIICSPLRGSWESERNMVVTMLGQKEASSRDMEQRRSLSFVLTLFPTLRRLVFLNRVMRGD
jgi:hypothetical protein